MIVMHVVPAGRDIVKDVTIEFTGKSEAVDFSLSDLRCIKAGKEDKRWG